MFGKLTKIDGNDITIHLDEPADLYRIQKYANGKQPLIEININDGRHITIDQRKKVFAMFNDIAKWTGYTPMETEQTMKFDFISRTGEPYFSFKNCSEELATRFIKYLIWFCLGFGIPFRSRTWDSIHDSYYFQLQCLLTRTCAVCGAKHAEIDHVTPVGMGRNRNKIDNSQFYFEALCHKHHMTRHKLGIITFMKRYHLKPIKLTREQIKKLRIGGVGNAKK